MYVLILAISFYGGVSVTTQEFGTQQACERAASSFVLAYNGYGRVVSSCTPKGDK